MGRWRRSLLRPLQLALFEFSNQFWRQHRRGPFVRVSGVHDLHDHPQRTHVAADRRRALRGALLILGNEFTDCRVVVSEFEDIGSSPGVRPERLDDLRCDSFGGGDFLRSGAPEDDAIRTVSRRRDEADVPVVSPGRRMMKVELPRCAANRDE